MWNYKRFDGEDITWYSEEEYLELVRKIEELTTQLEEYKVHNNES